MDSQGLQMMNEANTYLALSAGLMLLQWVPYILNRVFSWGLLTFLNNYPEGYPAQEPETPLWAQRTKRAHLNMIETFPAFAVGVLLANVMSVDEALVMTAAGIFFYSRIVYALVYGFGVPFLRTPTYLVSWAATLTILWSLLSI